MGVRVKGNSTVDGRTREVILEGESAEELAARVADLEAKVQDHEARLAALEASAP